MTYSIDITNVSKRYRIGQSIPTLRSLLGNLRNSDQENYHWALRDISFGLQSGEALGIIGPNGAGKTTILKLLSKVTYPTRGSIQINGRFSALIELGAGFHPDLTGRENIYLNGVILGLKKAEIDERFDQIVEFSGIGSYLDTPVKRYSSGMYARLGFSVAAHVNPEILLVDEVLAVGDMAFRQKCYDHMNKLINDGTTLIFVSHDFSAIQKVCTRCLVLYQGNLVFDGSPAEATAEYSNILRKSASSFSSIQSLSSDLLSQRVMTHAATIEDVKLIDSNNQPSLDFSSGERIRIQCYINFHEAAISPVFACTVRKLDGQVIYDYTTNWADQKTPNFNAGTLAIVEFSLQLCLIEDTYSVGVDIAYSDLSRYYDRIERALDFVVSGRDGSRGIANLDGEFSVVQTDTLN